jgi:hypothetical protein
MIQKSLPYLLITVISVIGILVTLFPLFSGEKAYYVNDTLYLNIKDSVDMGYNPYLKSIVQQKQYTLAFQEKSDFRTKHKDLGDSLSAALLDAKLGRKAVILEKTIIQQKELNQLISDKEFEIDEKYSLNQLDRRKYKEMILEIKKKTSVLDYVVAVANDQFNLDSSQVIGAESISLKKVNQQTKGPFILSGLFIILCAIVLYLFQRGVIPFENNTIKYLVIALLIICSIIMTGKIFGTFSDRILFDKTLNEREALVKEKLLNIRRAELNYYEAKNKYCNDWNELIRFYKNDSIKIVKYLVNKNDTAAVNLAVRNGEPLEEVEMIPALSKAFPDTKINLEELPYVPFSDNTFELNAGMIDKNGRDIHVFEVKTTKYDFVKDLKTLPENFDKSKSLVVGSMSEPITEGNW